MSDPTFGISITRVDNEPRPAVASDMSVAGIVGTAPDANAETFPLNTPVLVFSDDTAALTALGAAGTIRNAIELMNSQLGEFQVAARVVVVRVEEGEDDDETMENIIGSSVDKSGIWALPEAGPILGVIPRLICCPGFTSSQVSGLATLVLGTQGDNLTAAPTVVFTGGGSDPGKVLPTATAVLGTGANAEKVVALNITDRGKNLSGTLTVSFTGGGSELDKALPTATATIDKLANPVVAALPPVLSQLLGVAVVQGPATTLQAFTDWVETISSERIIPVETAVKVGVSATVRDSAPAVIGLGIKVDHEKAGAPFHSWANRPLYGIVGPNRPIRFSLTDGATEGQTILSQRGGIILRGEAGVETAIASGGHVFVGTDTCAEDTLWKFYNQVRGRDYIHLMFLRTLRYYLGKFNLTRHTIQAVENTMNRALRDLKSAGHILDYKVSFTRDLNSPSQLRLGRFHIGFAAEEPAPLTYLGIQSSRYLPALDTLLSDILAQVDTGA